MTAVRESRTAPSLAVAGAHLSYGYLAAPDADRPADLNAALADPTVRGVICTRGGYGVQRIFDGVDLRAVRQDPKPVVGFSDITGLQLWLWRNARLATVHGPMAAWNGSRTGPESAEALRAALMTTEEITLERDPDEPGAPFRLDRMLTQMRRSGVLDGAAGIALGQWVDCVGPPARGR